MKTRIDFLIDLIDIIGKSATEELDQIVIAVENRRVALGKLTINGNTAVPGPPNQKPR